VRQAVETGRGWSAALDGQDERLTELRALLVCYTEVAADRGLAEDPLLAPLYRAAKDALYEPPFGLAAAQRAVNAYIEAVRGREDGP
jgi:hypothetical protein